jgi:hypothetical protein
VTCVVVKTTPAPRPSWISLSPGPFPRYPTRPFRNVSAFDLFRDEPTASCPWRLEESRIRLPVSKLPTRSEFVTVPEEPLDYRV